jgi:endonuclease YncB( thermonuclease family)
MMAALALLLLAQDWRVIDGDTLRLDGETVRLADIDTPELHRPECDAERMLARLAAERLAALLQGREITLEREGQDRYGRTLARLMADGRNVGEILITEGYAVPWAGRRHDWCG